MDSDSPTLTKTERLCWKAPVGYYITEGNPDSHRLILQIYRWTLSNPDWEYDGTISTIQGKGKQCAKLSFSLIQVQVYKQSHKTYLPPLFPNKADVWKYEKGEGRDTLVLSRSTGETIKYSTRFGSQQVELEVLEFTAYEDAEDVPNVRLTDEEKKDCLVLVMPKEHGNYEPCEYCSEDLIQAAKE